MFDFTLQQLLYRLCAFVVVAAIHGAAVAAAAYALGDRGPRYDGRLRINPLVHLDLLGTLSGVLFSVGWAKPVAIDPKELRSGRSGLVVIVVLGMVATLATAAILFIVRPLVLPWLPDSASQAVFAIVDAIGQLSIWFVLFNMLPIPPLTGAHCLVAAHPAWRESLWRFALYGAILLTAIAATGLPVRWLSGVYDAVAAVLFRW